MDILEHSKIPHTDEFTNQEWFYGCSFFGQGPKVILRSRNQLKWGRRPFGARRASQISALWLQKHAFCLSLESLPSGQGQVFAEARGGMRWNEQYLGSTPGPAGPLEWPLPRLQ